MSVVELAPIAQVSRFLEWPCSSDFFFFHEEPCSLQSPILEAADPRTELGSLLSLGVQPQAGHAWRFTRKLPPKVLQAIP